MNLKKKIFLLAMSVLMGVGAIGVANAASPFNYSQDVILGTQQQSNLGTKPQSSAEKPAPEVTITETQTNMTEKTKSTFPQKSTTGKTQSPKFQDRTKANNQTRYHVNHNNSLNEQSLNNGQQKNQQQSRPNYQNHNQQNCSWQNAHNDQWHNQNCW